MNTKLVKANICDARQLATIHVSAWKEAYKNIIPKSYLDSLSIEKRESDFIHDLTKKEELEFYIIQYLATDVGLVILQRNDTTKTGNLVAFYLINEYCHKGIGSIVMDFIKTRFQQLDYHEIVLWVLKDNINAISFYKKHGFISNSNIKQIILGKILLEESYSYKLYE